MVLCLHKVAPQITRNPRDIDRTLRHNTRERPEEERKQGTPGDRKASNLAKRRGVLSASFFERHEMCVEGGNHSDQGSGVAF